VYLVAGLGNPGAKYAGNRHNVGFMVLDRFAAEHGAPAARERFQGAFTKLRVGNEDVGLLAPATFMNLSGRAVQQALHFFKVELDRLVVVHDELDLPFGDVRIKVGGGTAGHRGLASIVECCGGAGFCRVRVGIGRPTVAKVEAYVLQDFSSQDGNALPTVLERASASLADIVARGAQVAMNLHNRRPDSGSN
jgi:peptidyl-tRNA hydrolase, PTH1 family